MIRGITRRARQSVEAVAGHDYFIPLAAIFLGVNSTLSEFGGSTGLDRYVHAVIDLITLTAITAAFAHDRVEMHRWQQALARNRVATAQRATTTGDTVGPVQARPRHVTVQVMQWNPDDEPQAHALMQWIRDNGGTPYVDDWTDGSHILVEDHHDLRARPGDRVILGVTGRFFELPDADYQASYEQEAA